MNKPCIFKVLRMSVPEIDSTLLNKSCIFFTSLCESQFCKHVAIRLVTLWCQLLYKCDLDVDVVYKTLQLLCVVDAKLLLTNIILSNSIHKWHCLTFFVPFEIWCYKCPQNKILSLSTHKSTLNEPNVFF